MASEVLEIRPSSLNELESTPCSEVTLEISFIIVLDSSNVSGLEDDPFSFVFIIELSKLSELL